MITSLSVFVFNLEAEEEKEEIISIIFNSQESIYLTYLSTWKKRNATEKLSDNRVLQQQQQQKNISSPKIFDFYERRKK